MSAPVVTRIAPSPTGTMHIGTARTALFNWLFARAQGGRFLLRVEDTDRARSTPEATEAIYGGLRWLGLDWDGDAVSQFNNVPRHADVAAQMLAAGTAYKCFATQEEVAAFREAARAEGRSTLYHSPWRDTPADQHPDAPFVVRLKAPRDGETVIDDAVQGKVTFQNEQLDDMVLLRSDGTPTYMLAVVVDDHDMGITHVIRGDDHLNNAARQAQIFDAMGWPQPVWAHIPLIHGADGKKLSKRHGATGVEEYAAMGFPAEAMRNYLARLGWSHGDDEFFTDAQALEWFDLEGIGKAPARLDLKKLENISGQHLTQMEDAAILEAACDFAARDGRAAPNRDALLPAIPFVKEASKTLGQILDRAHFALTVRPIEPEPKAAKALDPVSRGILFELTPHLQTATWSRDALEGAVGYVAEARGLGLGKLAAPLRAALAGRTATPSVFDMMLVLGQAETLARIADVAADPGAQED
ncbi:glutamate--tRNA ligase 1 [Jannaschia pagri]|uniref:Glutamate--tRNA ligase n=1 Tax=Jannaschia pagri TaxID=2829797 RepID=A0ABQ4NNJ7_9RHOB|nr:MULTISPECIES: glutamate--tRNA ligase [unclassified Jannaschia]GIT92158.1 glutamate--tRNA ligase 1 [Jannaschia sp. AI_61]GIT95993.1 glutamate--tRNA ligase 1 [Jannaschia sp. AI_62]